MLKLYVALCYLMIGAMAYLVSGDIAGSGGVALAQSHRPDPCAGTLCPMGCTGNCCYIAVHCCGVSCSCNFYPPGVLVCDGTCNC